MTAPGREEPVYCYVGSNGCNLESGASLLDAKRTLYSSALE